MRTTIHETSAQAVSYLDEQTNPYAYAVLSRRSDRGWWEPCDWEGDFIADDAPWPRRTGINGEHPMYQALMDDWKSLAQEGVETHRYSNSRSILEIATAILSKRYPNVSGYIGKLAQELAVLTQVMTVREIEEEFNLSSGTVRQYLKAHSDTIICRKSGATWFIARSEAERIWGHHKRQ